MVCTSRLTIDGTCVASAYAIDGADGLAASTCSASSPSTANWTSSHIEVAGQGRLTSCRGCAREEFAGSCHGDRGREVARHCCLRWLGSIASHQGAWAGGRELGLGVCD